MSIPCLKWLLGLALACWLAGPALSTAQPPDPYPLPHSWTDDSGVITLFYPAGWLQPGEGLALSDESGDLDLQAELIESPAPPADWEAIPDWLIAEGYLPGAALFSEESYAGWPAWLAQGRGLFARGVFSAVAVIPLPNGAWVWLRADFPAEDLSAAAPLVTAIFRQMKILPVYLLSPAGDFGLNLPANWFYSGSPGILLAGQTESDWAAWQNGDVPSGLGLGVYLLDAETPPPTPIGLLSDERALRINGQAAQVQLFYDPVTGATEVRLSRGGYLLRALSYNRDLLLQNLPLWQAILGSLVLGQDS
jgi:hypothetical protein